MPQTVQQLKAKEAALKKAMAANPSNKATQRLGASSLATTQSKLSASQNKVSTGINLKNTAAETKTSSQIASQQTLRGNYLNSRATSTPINTVNGRASSNQLVRGNAVDVTGASTKPKAEIRQISEGFNVVYDPATGKNYSPNSKRGKELLAQSGVSYADYIKSVKSAGAGTQEVATYAQLGEDLLNKDFADRAAVEKELFGEKSKVTSLDDYKKAQAESIQRQYVEGKRALDYQQEASDASYTDSKRSIATGGNLLQTQLASSQEGVISNSATLDRMRTLTAERQSRLIAEKNDIDAKISEARAQLEEAYAAGKTALANDVQGKLNAYEMEAKRIDTDLSSVLTQQLGAESEYARTQSAITQSGLTLFQGVVAQGTPMDYATIQGYAQQLNLPTDLLMGYYQSAEIIRTDKTLDQETKVAQLAQLNQDLQDQITGMDTQAAKNAKAYISLVQMGVSQDVLDSFKEAAGMRVDPFEQVKGEALILENKIRQYQVDNLGKAPPVGSPEWVQYQSDLLDLQAKNKELRDMYGYEDITLDEAKSIFFVDGKSAFHQNDPAWGDGTNQWECGEGYRKITDYPNPVGNTYTEKFSKVTKGLQTPQIGFGLVLPLGDSGHLETVISDPDPVTGTFQTLSWNRNGKGGMTIENYNINDLNAKYGDGWGFIESSLKPEFAQKLASAGLGGEESNPYSYQYYYNEAKDQNMSNEAASKYAEKQFELASTFKNEFSQKQYMIYSTTNRANKVYGDVIENMTDEELVNYAEKNNYISQRLIDYNGEDKLTSAIINELTDDQQTRDLIRAQAEWVGAVLRGQSGAAITVAEYLTETAKYFPTRGDDADAIRSLFEKRKLYTSDLEKSLDLHGRSLAWEDAQAELAASNAEQQIDPDVEEYNSYSDLQDDDYWAGREALGLPAPWIERAMDLVQSKANQ